MFTALGATELGDLAAVFDLGTVQHYEPIAAGTINTNFALATERGRYFVRLNEGKAEADVAWEARLVTALSAAGVVTPPPLVAKDGRPYAECMRKWASVFPWRDGQHVSGDHVTPAIAETFGAALGDLHRAGLEVPSGWRRGSIYDHDHLASRFDR